MDLHGKNFIDGALSAEGQSRFRAQNPKGSVPLEPNFFEATDAEVAKALQAADLAFQEMRREKVSTARFLHAAADAIMDLGQELIDRAMAETGLPEARFVGERGRTVGQIRMFADVVEEGSWVDARIDRPIPDREPLPKPDVRQMLVPLGPIVVFGASNFPLAFSAPGGDTASALAAGNPVVVKAHPAHPGTSELIANAFLAAQESTGLPPGIFSLVHGAAYEVGLALVKEPRTRAVAFTGSLAGGRALFDAASSRPEPIPVFAEMGSSNPVFLLPSALEERGDQVAEDLHQSLILGVGQFCTNPGLLVGLEGRELDSFLATLGDLVCQTPPATMLHSGICGLYRDGVDGVRRTPGVEIVAESNQQPEEGHNQARVTVSRTNAETFLSEAHLAEEVFGPATLVVSCGSRRDLEEIARNLEGHLTATIHGTPEELQEHQSLLSILERKVGRLIFNGVPTGVEICPSIVHGGPYPATTDSRTTSVGTNAIKRFARPVCYQDFPDAELPAELRNRNEKRIWRMVDGELTRGDV